MTSIEKTRPLFSLVIPAYNESKRLPPSIRDIQTFFSRFSTPFEVIIVVEKSTDNTVAVARLAIGNDTQIRVIENAVKRGKGYAVRLGMLEAKGEMIFFMDADLSTPLAEVVAFLGEFQSRPEIDVVIGSRSLEKSLVIKKQSWLRRNMGRTFNTFVQLISIRGIIDTQCGFKAFRARAAREIFTRTTIDGFAFDVEVLLLARKMGFQISERPVRWVNSPESKVRILIDPIKMFIDLIQIRYRVRRALRARPRD